MRPQSPCKDCPDREVGCHSKCQKYAEFRKGIDESNMAVDEKRRGDREWHSYVIRRNSRR